MTPTIRHISFSQAGGAGGVANTLAAEQRSLGYDSEVVSVINSTLRTQPMSSPLHTVAAGIDEYLLKKQQFNSSLSVIRDRVPSSIAEQIPSGSIVHLHGINGAVSMAEVAELSKNHRVVWTLHDMNPFTGGCHYSLGCTAFEAGCAQCPASTGLGQHLIEKSFAAKQRAWAAMDQISLVAPSQWLADLGASSALIAGRSIGVVPNPFAQDFREHSETTEPQAPERIIVGVVAADLSDRVKNVAEAVAAFEIAKQSNPHLELHLVGARGGEHGGATQRLGRLTGEKLKDFYSTCDALVLPSLAENSPLVITEAGSQGCLTFARNSGGTGELVETLGHGSTYSSVDHLAHLLSSFEPLSGKQRRDLRVQANSVFSPAAVAKQYDDVYAAATI